MVEETPVLIELYMDGYGWVQAWHMPPHKEGLLLLIPQVAAHKLTQHEIKQGEPVPFVSRATIKVELDFLDYKLDKQRYLKLTPYGSSKFWEQGTKALRRWLATKLARPVRDRSRAAPVARVRHRPPC